MKLTLPRIDAKRDNQIYIVPNEIEVFVTNRSTMYANRGESFYYGNSVYSPAIAILDNSEIRLDYRKDNESAI